MQRFACHTTGRKQFYDCQRKLRLSNERNSISRHCWNPIQILVFCLVLPFPGVWFFQFSGWFFVSLYKFVLNTDRILQEVIDESDPTNSININCVDPLGRSALLMAIDNENLGMVELLINFNVDTKDALLHAISEEFVEAVEMLLDHEDCNRSKDGQHVSG